MNGEFSDTWKEAIVAWFEAISWHLPGQTDKNRVWPVRITDDPAESQTRYLPNTILER
jgi:hypothetical protein